MKKIVLALSILIIIGFITLNTGSNPTVASKEHDLLNLVSAFQGENIDINGWSLHAREKTDNLESLEEVQEHVTNLKEKFPNWDWAITSESDQWEAKATKVTSGGQKEHIKILSTLTNHKPQTYIIYEAQGKQVDQQTEKFLKEDLSHMLSDIFRGNATIFSCIKGEFSAMMETSLSDTANNLLSTFQADEVESLKENSFISISAYSSLFAESITTNEEEMNLQIGLRTQGLGAKTTLVVGTPIITIEY